MLPILLGIMLVIVHFFSEKFHLLRHIQRMKFISFTGGIFISYLILHILPEVFVGDAFLNRVAMIFVLIGFSLFHLMEKYVYRHERRREQLKRELKEVHSIAFFLYHFLLGVVLISIIDQLNLMEGILFFIPLLLIAFVSSISLKGIHGQIRQKKSVKAMLSISPLLGVVISTFFPLTNLLHSMLLGFVVGALLFIVIVDSIPKERKGEPVFFILGVTLYFFIIGLTWLL
jgi:hypothetical protein